MSTNFNQLAGSLIRELMIETNVDVAITEMVGLLAVLRALLSEKLHCDLPKLREQRNEDQKIDETAKKMKDDLKFLEKRGDEFRKQVVEKVDYTPGSMYFVTTRSKIAQVLDEVMPIVIRYDLADLPKTGRFSAWDGE
jgi:hypothetical protein